jgi:hypothetical protein
MAGTPTRKPQPLTGTQRQSHSSDAALTEAESAWIGSAQKIIVLVRPLASSASVTSAGGVAGRSLPPSQPALAFRTRSNHCFDPRDRCKRASFPIGSDDRLTTIPAGKTAASSADRDSDHPVAVDHGRKGATIDRACLLTIRNAGGFHSIRGFDALAKTNRTQDPGHGAPRTAASTSDCFRQLRSEHEVSRRSNRCSNPQNRSTLKWGHVLRDCV